MKKFFVSLILFLVLFNIHGASHYIRAGASGAANGNNWTDAWTNFPAYGSMVRGDTYYVADGTYPNYEFRTAANGTNWIFIKKATTNDHGIDTGWDASYGDGQAIWNKWEISVAGRWEFNGVVGSGSNATSYGFSVINIITNANNFGAIEVNVGIDNLRFYYINIDAGGTEVSTEQIDGLFIQGSSGSLDWHTNGIVAHCYIHDANRCPIIARGLLDWTFEYNWIARNKNNGGTHAELASLGDYVSSNPGPNHGGSPTCVNNIWRYNILQDADSTGGIVYLDCWATNIYIYGNIFVNLDSRFRSDRWVSTSSGDDAVWGFYVYNNTFAGSVASGSILNRQDNGYGGPYIAYNNLYYSNAPASTYSGVWTHDYNWYYPSKGSGGNEGEPNGQLGTSIPFVNYAVLNLNLAANTISGTNLSEVFVNDFSGSSRTTWSRGAYEYIEQNIFSPKRLRIINKLTTQIKKN